MSLLLTLAFACTTPDLDGDGFDELEDCDDDNADVFPGADELCDGIDSDCDDVIDEEAGDALNFFADADGDGFGDPRQAQRSLSITEAVKATMGPRSLPCAAVGDADGPLDKCQTGQPQTTTCKARQVQTMLWAPVACSGSSRSVPSPPHAKSARARGMLHIGVWVFAEPPRTTDGGSRNLSAARHGTVASRHRNCG